MREDSNKLKPIQSVAAIVVTYNAEKWLALCLGSLRSSEHPVSTIVVDNASSDNTVEIVRKEYPEVRLVIADHNLGFGSANNAGFQALSESPRPDAVYLLNQDAAVEPDTIGQLVRALDDNPSFGVVSPLHYASDGKEIDALFRSYIGKCTGGQGVVEVPFVNAAHWLIRRECLDELRGFAPIFHHYGEDGNFLQRLRKAGWRVGIDFNARAIHAREERRGSRERNLLNHYGVYLGRACNPLYPAWITLPRAWWYLVRRLLFLDAWPSKCFWPTMRKAWRDLPAIWKTRRSLKADLSANPARSILDELGDGR